MPENFTRYVVTLTRRPGVNMGIDLARKHVAFLEQLDERGLLELAGPFEDELGGMWIVRARSLEEARALAAADPFVSSGAETCEVRCWLLSCAENNHMGLGRLPE